MTDQSKLAQNVPFLIDDTGRPVFAGQRRALTGVYFNSGTDKETTVDRDNGVRVYVEGTHNSPTWNGTLRAYFTLSASDKAYHSAVRTDKPESVPVLETLQDLFNMVAAQLLLVNAGRRSATPSGCVYRAENGDRCAVGGLLPESVVQDPLVRGSLHNSFVKAAVASQGVQLHEPDGASSELLRFLLDAQLLHDDGYGPLKGTHPNDAPKGYYKMPAGRRKYFWKRTLKRWAKRNNLIWLPVFDRA